MNPLVALPKRLYGHLKRLTASMERLYTHPKRLTAHSLYEEAPRPLEEADSLFGEAPATPSVVSRLKSGVERLSNSLSS